MDDFAEKTAFITGGASGIGLGMAEAFGREGMSVMIADIDGEFLAEALAYLRALGIEAEGAHCNVADKASVEAAAQATLNRFGKVHVVCNNAGVPVGGALGKVSIGDWGWVIDVNQRGVVHGMEVFAPLIAAHGEGGWFVNTASMAGLVSVPGMEPYAGTKAAVVAMSEGWATQLARKQIGVSVLCPGIVASRLDQSERHRPSSYGEMSELVRTPPRAVTLVQDEGIPALVAGNRVVEAIRQGEFYIFTHPEFKAEFQSRCERVLAAFDRAADSPVLRALPPRELPFFLNSKDPAAR